MSNGKFDISVVVAAKNESIHIREALESIVRQEGIAHEIIFVDDNSTDDTLKIATDISEKHENIKIFKNPKKGKCSAFNYGVSKADGRFTCLFAGDDIMPKDSLKSRFDAIKEQSDETPVVGLSKLITKSENPRYNKHTIPKKKNQGATSGVSPLMNKKALHIIFPTPEQLPNEDTWMELAILHLPGWKIIHSNTICCQWRVHSGNSINYQIPFDEFNKKITVRMSALQLFMNKYGNELNTKQHRILREKINIENKRKNGNWVGILFTRSNLIDRLRSLSMSTALTYEIRRRLYGLLSGW